MGSLLFRSFNTLIRLQRFANKPSLSLNMSPKDRRVRDYPSESLAELDIV